MTTPHSLPFVRRLSLSMLATIAVAGSGRMLLARVVKLSQNLRWCLCVYIVCVTLIFVTHLERRKD